MQTQLLAPLVRHLKALSTQVAHDAAAGDTSDDARGRERLCTQLGAAAGAVVKAAVTGAGATPELWGCAAVYWDAMGESPAAGPRVLLCDLNPQP